MKRVNLHIFLLLIILFQGLLFSQIPGEEPRNIPSDTTFIFNSPRSLIQDQQDYIKKNGIGLKVAFSNSGFAFGFNYLRKLGENYSFDLGIIFSGRRENENGLIQSQYPPQRGQFIVPNKVNRIYVVPLIAGLKRYFFKYKIANSFKPFVGAGVGANLILRNPYLRNGPELFAPGDGFIYFVEENTEIPEGSIIYGEFRNFFQSIPNTELFFKPGAYMELGVEFETSLNSFGSVNVTYHYIPGFDLELQSLYNRTIDNFGGLFISLNINRRF